MTVKFAIPVLNETAAKILQTFGATETAIYFQMLDQFFDCLNVGSLGKHQKETKPFLKLNISENDEIFSWMTNQFLPSPNSEQAR